MSWSFSGSGFALTLRRLRGRFGISAPRVAVRTHVPWYLRTAGLVVAAGFSVILIAWAYDAGRRSAGFDQGGASQAAEELRLANKVLEDEVARLRSLLTISESSLQIEQAAQRNLSEKNTNLAEENAKLKEEVIVFQKLAKLEGKHSPLPVAPAKVETLKSDTGKSEQAVPDGSVSIDRLSLRQDAAPGHYRYSFMLALQGARRGKETKLNLQIVLSPRAGTSNAKIVLPRQGDKDLTQYEIALRNFRRIDGKFELPADFVAGAAEFRISEAGILKASKKFDL